MSPLGDFEHHLQIFVGDYIPNKLGDVSLGHLPTPVFFWVDHCQEEATMTQTGIITSDPDNLNPREYNINPFLVLSTSLELPEANNYTHGTIILLKLNLPVAELPSCFTRTTTDCSQHSLRFSIIAR